MLNINPALINSLIIELINPANPRNKVRLMVIKPEISRSISFIRRTDLDDINSGKKTRILIRTTSYPDTLAEGEDIVIHDNQPLLGKYIIQVNAHPLHYYLTRSGKVVKALNPAFHFGSHYGHDIKTIKDFHDAMIEHQCYYDSMEEAVAQIELAASNADPALFAL